MPTPLINYLMIRSADPVRVRDFYAALGLHFVTERHRSGREHYSCDLGSMVFAIQPAGIDGAVSDNSMLGFQVASLERVLRAVPFAGGRIVVQPQEDGPVVRAIVLDPDGRKVEVTQSDPAFSAAPYWARGAFPALESA